MSPPLIQIGGKAVSTALIHAGGKALCPTLYQIGGKALSQILAPILVVRPPTFDRAAGSVNVHLVARKQSISQKKIPTLKRKTIRKTIRKSECR